MAFHLIVKHQFAHYHVGARIEDQHVVERILAGPNEHHVVRIAAPNPDPPIVAAAETIAKAATDVVSAVTKPRN